MLLQVNAQPNTLTGTTFSFVVPGHQLWMVRSVVAVASTHVGGQPNRGYTLTIARGTTTVAKAGADDAGTEPATVTVTWADMPASSVGAGNVGTSVGAVTFPTIEPGYVLTGTILNSVAGDAWTSATCWFEFVDS
jgi:hypothetical protein